MPTLIFTQQVSTSTLTLIQIFKNISGTSIILTTTYTIQTIVSKLLLLLLMLLMVVSLPNWVHVTKTKTLHLVPTKLFKQTVTGVLQWNQSLTMLLLLKKVFIQTLVRLFTIILTISQVLQHQFTTGTVSITEAFHWLMHFNNHVTLQPLKLSKLLVWNMLNPSWRIWVSSIQKCTTQMPSHLQHHHQILSMVHQVRRWPQLMQPLQMVVLTINHLTLNQSSLKMVQLNHLILKVSKPCHHKQPTWCQVCWNKYWQVVQQLKLMFLVQSMLVRLVHLTTVTMSTIKYKKKVVSMLTLWFRMKLSLVTILSMQWRFGQVTKTVKHHFMVQTLISLNKSTV